MLRTWHLVVSTILGLLVVLGPGVSLAQQYPSKPISLVVPSSPGSVADVLARAMAPGMSKLLGQPIVIENKPGADQVLGMEHVAKAAPADGHTIVIVTVTSAAMLPILKDNLRFDPLKDLPPFIDLGEAQIVLTTASTRPWKTLDELTAHAKAHPGTLNYGSSSPSVQLPMAAIVRDRGIDVSSIPYSQGSAFQMALTTGEVDMGLLTSFNANNFKDKLRFLAVSGDKRTAAFSGVPTFAELGHPNVRGIAWSLNVRAGTPETVTRKLHSVASQVLKRPDMAPIFERLGLTTVPDSPEAAAERLAAEARFYSTLAPSLKRSAK